MADKKLYVMEAELRLTICVIAESEVEARELCEASVPDELSNQDPHIFCSGNVAYRKSDVPIDWLGCLPYSNDSEQVECARYVEEVDDD